MGGHQRYGRWLAAVVFLALWLGVGCSAARPDFAVIESEVEKQISHGAPELAAVRAVVVSVNGDTVIEHYRDSDASEYAHVWSVTKSVMSILIGIALDEGHLTSLDQTLAELLPRYRPEMTDQVAAITLRQLLTHTSGLPGGGAGDGLAWSADDTVELIIVYGLVNDPGVAYGYSNSGAHLVGAVLTQATGRTVLDYARERLFDPLGISTRPAFEGFDAGEPGSKFDDNGFAWGADRRGIHTGCCLLKLTAPDMIKIGELYLNDGKWNGRRIVSADWVRESTKPQVTPEQRPDSAYGYFWWLDEVRGHQTYRASGAYGQAIAVVPDMGLVVAVSTRDDKTPEFVDLDPLIFDVIMRSLE